MKTKTREESTCYPQTSARIERDSNYVVQKCPKRTQVIIVGFARFLSKWSLEILASKAILRLRISFPSPSPVTSPFSRTPTPWDVFFPLPKPFPSLNPRWRSLDQNALARVFARQNTPALQANNYKTTITQSIIPQSMAIELFLREQPFVQRSTVSNNGSCFNWITNVTCPSEEREVNEHFST